MPTSNDAGLALDEYFDFLIDSTGDIQATEEAVELQKDLSTGIVSIVDDSLIGTRLTANQMEVVETNIESFVGSDDRVINVNQVAVGRRIPRDEASIFISIDSIYGVEEFFI